MSGEEELQTAPPVSIEAESMEVAQESVLQQDESITEEAQEVELTPEELEAEKTMRALDEVVTIKDQLSKDNSQYELHVKFIGLLKQLDFKQELEEARVAMHSVYPLSENLWLDWIEDAKQDADTPEGETRLLQLYDLAQEDYLLINVWKNYMEFKLEKFYSFIEDIEDFDDDVDEYVQNVREDLLKAVRATSAHVKQSDDIWKPYSEFELYLLNKFNDSIQLLRVKEMYLTRLSILHIDCENTFNAYSSFISNHFNSDYETYMIEANKTYAKIKVAAASRDIFEMDLVSSGYTLESFYSYIEYERSPKFMFSVNNVRSLYERAIVIYCTDANLWDDYILFLIQQTKIQSFLETTCSRALRNCPWSGTLWAHLVRIMESGERDDDLIEAEFNRALSTKVILSNVDELVKVLLAKCDFKRRMVDWEDIDEEAVMDLRVTFEECLQYISDVSPESGDPYYRIEKYYAYILLKKFGDVERAREIWQSVVQSHGLDTEAWIQYILFERDQENYQQCSALFRQAIQKNIDNPARLIDVWTSIEHEIGTIESYEQALIKINYKNKALSKQWANYATQDDSIRYVKRERKPREERKPKPQVKEIVKPKVEEKEEKSEEKKMMDRKKKSAHRLAQKQRQKEKKALEKELAEREKSEIEATEHDTVPHDNNVSTSQGNADDDTIFKKPLLPQSRQKAQVTEKASEKVNSLSQAEEMGSSPQIEEEGHNERKRKLSDEGDLAEESKKVKTNDTFEKPTSTFAPRPRYMTPIIRQRKQKKIGIKAINKNDIVNTDTASTSEQPGNSEDSTAATAPKSNADFRAMLLGKK